MVRGWHEGSYEELYENVCLWFEDLRLILPGGKGMTRPPKLKALCLRMLKPSQGTKTKIWERMDRELSNLAQRVAYAAIRGYPLPDEAAYRILHWLRAYFLADKKQGNGESGDAEKGSNAQETDVSKYTGQETLAYQFLKAWHRRKQRKEGEEEIM